MMWQLHLGVGISFLLLLRRQPLSRLHPPQLRRRRLLRRLRLLPHLLMRPQPSLLKISRRLRLSRHPRKLLLQRQLSRFLRLPRESLRHRLKLG